MFPKIGYCVWRPAEAPLHWESGVNQGLTNIALAATKCDVFLVVTWKGCRRSRPRRSSFHPIRGNRSRLKFTPLRDNHIPPRPRLISPFLHLERNRYRGTDIRSETARIASTIPQRLLETKSGRVLPTTV